MVAASVTHESNLDALPTDRTITPQGWIGATTNPNDDNVGLWLHDNGPSSLAWTIGQSRLVSYWLIAQDNPSDPIGDLGLRPGLTFLNFAGTSNCVAVHPPDVPSVVRPILGLTGRAMELVYNLGTTNGKWSRIRCNFNPPLNLAAYDHLRLEWRGSLGGGNSLQVGVVNPIPGGERIFARGFNHVTQHVWWGQSVIPFKFLAPWTPGTQFDPTRVSALFFSVVKEPGSDVGGTGRLAIDNLGAFNVAARVVPSTFTRVSGPPLASASAVNWLAIQQRPTELVKSWQEEAGCLAHGYDQALALLIFS